MLTQQRSGRGAHLAGLRHETTRLTQTSWQPAAGGAGDHSGASRGAACASDRVPERPRARGARDAWGERNVDAARSLLGPRTKIARPLRSPAPRDVCCAIAAKFARKSAEAQRRRGGRCAKRDARAAQSAASTATRPSVTERDRASRNASPRKPPEATWTASRSQAVSKQRTAGDGFAQRSRECSARGQRCRVKILALSKNDRALEIFLPHRRKWCAIY